VTNGTVVAETHPQTDSPWRPTGRRKAYPMAEFHGIIPPVVTPFDVDENIDEAALRREVSYMISEGVHGICMTGSTGEGHTLTAEESAEVARIAVDEAAGRVPVISGIIQNSTRTCVQYAELIAKAGVAGLQVTPVHYLYEPGPDETINHYRVIAEQIGLPIIIYNVVPWAMVDVPTLQKMVQEVPSVVAVKQSGRDLHMVADLLAGVQKLSVLAAVDDLLYPAFALGAHGSVSGSSSLAPGLCVQLWRAVQEGDHVTALSLHERLLPLWRAVEAPNMPALIKECLAQQGRAVGVPRRPCDPTTEAQRDVIRQAIERAGL
jgi:4-hydroxy-tetrahydrodipicolinate synthase